jgi:hypothetical protein
MARCTLLGAAEHGNTLQDTCCGAQFWFAGFFFAFTEDVPSVLCDVFIDSVLGCPMQWSYRAPPPDMFVWHGSRITSLVRRGVLWFHRVVIAHRLVCTQFFGCHGSWARRGLLQFHRNALRSRRGILWAPG